jgi:DivIVA domain-containing protein
MMWFFAILIVLALGGVAVVASGRGQPLGPAYDDAPDSLVPSDGPVTADDLRRIRFPLAFRGYRMAEVDALLERLAEERETLDRGDVPDTPPPTGPPTGPPYATPSGQRPEGDSDPSASAH